MRLYKYVKNSSVFVIKISILILNHITIVQKIKKKIVFRIFWHILSNKSQSLTKIQVFCGKKIQQICILTVKIIRYIAKDISNTHKPITIYAI